MKITFVSPPPNLSGGLRVVAIYADRLKARGHEVVVIAPRWQPPGWKARAKALARGRWLLMSPPASHFDKMEAELRLLDHGGQVTDSDVPEADVVIATWWETAFSVAALSPAKGRKFYFVQHHEVHSHLPSHISAGSYHLPLRKVTISGWLRDIMVERYGDGDVALVPNSVDIDLFHAPPRGRQAVPTVGLMYSETPFKGVDIALAALARLKVTHPAVQVVSFGAQPPSRDLALPIGSRFFLRPTQEELRSIYAMCDVWLCGSRSEGFHLPPLEAMACRTPVVSTRVGGPTECVTEGVNGFLADIEDVDGLADGLRRVLDLPEPEWMRASNAALAQARSYSWDDAAALFEKALLKE